MHEMISSTSSFENELDPEMDSQTIRENLLQISRTPNQFSLATKVARPIVYQILEVVIGPDWRDTLSTGISRNNSTTILSSTIQKQILNELRVPYIDEIPYLQREGWKTLEQVAHENEITKQNTILFANRIEPEWRQKSYLIPIGQRRAFLLAPQLCTGIQTISSLTTPRQLLGIWKGMETRNIAPFKLPPQDNEQELIIFGQFFSQFIQDDEDRKFFNIHNFQKFLDPLAKEEIQFQIRAWKRSSHATQLLEHIGLLDITDDERAMLKDFQRQGRRALATLVLTNMPFALRIANKHYTKIKNRSIYYDLIPPFGLEYESVKALFSSIKNYFESSQEEPFEDYIYSFIQQHLKDYVSQLQYEFTEEE